MFSHPHLGGFPIANTFSWCIGNYENLIPHTFTPNIQYVQIDLEFPTNVSGIGIQAQDPPRPNNCWTSLAVYYSLDNITFLLVNSTQGLTFTTCNTALSNNAIENHPFAYSVLARYIRVRVLSFKSNACGRVGLFVANPSHIRATSCFKCEAGGYSISGSSTGCVCPPGFESCGYTCPQKV